MRKIASVLLVALTIASASAQDWKQYLPEVHGTVRGNMSIRLPLMNSVFKFVTPESVWTEKYIPW